jgi:hypothetical protein
MNKYRGCIRTFARKWDLQKRTSENGDGPDLPIRPHVFKVRLINIEEFEYFRYIPII